MGAGSQGRVPGAGGGDAHPVDHRVGQVGEGDLPDAGLGIARGEEVAANGADLLRLDAELEELHAGDLPEGVAEALPAVDLDAPGGGVRCGSGAGWGGLGEGGGHVVGAVITDRIRIG